MQDLRTILSDEQLARLRASYDGPAFVRAQVRAFATAYPPLTMWNEAIADTFYSHASPLAPIDRERCIVAMLAHGGHHLPLAFHVYCALMEGVSPEAVCHIVGLAGCYGGVDRAGAGLQTVENTLRCLSTLPEHACEATRVHAALVETFRATP
jgi:alkylhydroperoxidase/carboxymuconolactone decarboxylase family protein YurZ